MTDEKEKKKTIKKKGEREKQKNGRAARRRRRWNWRDCLLFLLWELNIGRRVVADETERKGRGPTERPGGAVFGRSSAAAASVARFMQLVGAASARLRRLPLVSASGTLLCRGIGQTPPFHRSHSCLDGLTEPSKQQAPDSDTRTVNDGEAGL